MNKSRYNVLAVLIIFSQNVSCNTIKDIFTNNFITNLKNCTWNPHEKYSVFTQFDKEFYLASYSQFLHKYKCFYAVSKTISPKIILELGTNGGAGADAYLSGALPETQ